MSSPAHDTISGAVPFLLLNCSKWLFLSFCFIFSHGSSRTSASICTWQQIIFPNVAPTPTAGYREIDSVTPIGLLCIETQRNRLQMQRSPDIQPNKKAMVPSLPFSLVMEFNSLIVGVTCCILPYHRITDKSTSEASK
jgi:hypothetical protein